MSGDSSKTNKKWIGVGATILIISRLGRSVYQLSKSDFISSEITTYIQILINILPAILILIGGILLIKSSNLEKRWGIIIVITQALQIIQSSSFYYFIDKFSYSSPLFQIYQIVGTISYITFAITLLLFFNYLRKNWKNVKSKEEDNKYDYFK